MKKRHLNRRQFLKGTAAGLTAAGLPGGVFHIGRAGAETAGRVIILGFDGVEPHIVDEMMARNELPHLARLRQGETCKRLTTTIPPQSPVAWSSFMTCKNPGGHNIFDFIRRDPAGRFGPMPLVGTGTLNHPELDPNGALKKGADAVTYRKGNTFWSVADAQGKRAKILNVPFAFPADTLKNGMQLCGLGVPDLRGTTSTFFELSDAFTSAQMQEPLSGGKRIPLEFDASGAAKVAVPGPRDNRYRFSDPKAFTETGLTLRLDRKGGAGEAVFNKQRAELRPGVWSDWLELEFAMSPSFSVYSLTRFYPLAISDQEVRIYMACQQFHPEKPYTPFSHPEAYAAELQKRYGPYKTVGWAYDTHALRQDVLTEESFIADMQQTMAWRERLTLDEIEKGGFDMLISAWTATDRIGHMFWRFRDPGHPLYDAALEERYGKTLEKCYAIMDRIVGKVADKINDNDILMVMSDHGFGSWRSGFNVNNWLRDQGYLKVGDPGRAERGFLMGIDWSATKAYAIGLSSVYLNIRGRESAGCVAPDDAENLIGEIKDRLLQVKHDKTGDPVLRSVYTRADYSGEAVENAPDFSLGYQRYYQSSKNCAKGAVDNSGLFEINANKWSGEHAASDMAWKPGIFFCNRKIEKDKPDIRDIGVTTLKMLNADAPADYEGDALI
jgi:predicted AlkP superfamily phosphohydrolase/phosphomutase